MSDIEYYRQRAGEERERAKASNNPKAVTIHEKLAESYEELIELLSQDSRAA